MITLTDQDPDVVDNALEYLYTGQCQCLIPSPTHHPQRFVDRLCSPIISSVRECYVETFHEHEVDSKNVMASLDLHAYRELVPLYRLADFLGLDLLCSKIVLTLTEVNRHLAPRLQRLSKFNVPLDENFKAGLTRCAELAYGVLIRQSEEGQTGRSGNIRSVFVDLFDLARYRPLNDTLDWLVESAPRLLADILIRIQQREKVGACLDVENFDATAPAAGSTRWMLK